MVIKISVPSQLFLAMKKAVLKVASWFCGIKGHTYRLDYDENKRVRLRCINCGHIKRI